MHKYLTDANCLVSFVTDRSPSQQKKIAVFFEQAACFKCLVAITGTTVAEFVYVMQKVYRYEKAEISAVIKAVLATPGFDTIEKFDIQAVLHLWPEKIPDYGDAAIAAEALSSRYAVLTFDRTFGKQLQKLHIPHAVL